MILRSLTASLGIGLLAGGFLLSVATTPVDGEESTVSVDQRWQHIKNLQRELSGDAPKGVNEIEYFAPAKAQLHKEAAAFAADYAKDPKRWEAWLLVLKTDVFPSSAVERKPIFQRHEEIVSNIAEANDAPPEVKQNAERAILFQYLDHLDLIATPQEATGLDKRITAFLQAHPDDPKAASLQIRRLDVLAKSDPAKVRPLLDDLAASNNASVATAARGRIARLVYKDTPLDWKFTSLDGREVDFSQMRGQMVLIDFWASWCPDCLRALPRVLSAYHKYHGKGFEIVGVSLDNDQEALTGYLKKHDLPWPEHYDGKGWETELAAKYGVRGIPEMWLVGKDGHVIATGVESDELDARLAATLGE